MFWPMQSGEHQTPLHRNVLVKRIVYNAVILSLLAPFVVWWAIDTTP